MNKRQKGYLMRLLKSGIILFGGIIFWLVSLVPSYHQNSFSFMAILTFTMGGMDILINIITVFDNPDYFKGEAQF